MRNAKREAIRLMTVAMVGFLVAGCQSGPRWDWWRIGKANPADSSPVARTASVELPSVAASRAEKGMPGLNPANAGMDGGGFAPQFQPGIQAPAADSLAANAASYPTTGYSTSTLPGIPPTVGSPMHSGSPVAPPNTGQQGPYDPNSYAASQVAQAPLSTQSPQFSTPGVANRQAPVYLPSAATVPSYGAAPGPSSPAFNDTFSPPPANSAVNGPATMDPYSPEFTENSLRNRVNEPAATIAVQPPGMYRPGGTSDYPGMPPASYSIATRPEYPGTSPYQPPAAPIDSTGFPTTNGSSNFE
ncbi:MAG: hypothetical protein JW829_19440 [Pirellulales bacterium]|nr:hypothetical protein [Pirellulales bacterium]